MSTLSKEEASSSSYSASPPWEYVHDVFLSFRGEDTRTNFTDHLYNALILKNINTFKDDLGLDKGKPISELFKAIEESRFAVIVFSENYADSKWCLKELAKIVECMEKRQMTVLPVFYHVDPTNVRNQTSTFAKFFAHELPCKRKKCSMEEEETWKAALKKVGNLIGWHIQRDRPESEYICQIVKDILQKLCDKTKGFPLLEEKLVGQQFETNLHNIWESLMKGDVLRIGIHGMGGVGKTTLVTHIHNRLQEKVGSSNVLWVTVSQGFSNEKLQTKISESINLDLPKEDVKKRAAKLAKALRRKKLILILDDVWEYFSLEEVGIPVEENFCKLILTTRFLDVCQMMFCQGTFVVKPLNEEESWKLFMEKFGHDIVLPNRIKDIARSIANECAGLPLGIIIVARSMRGVGIDIHGWRNALEELKNSIARPDYVKDKVFGVLKYSYSNLKDSKLQECFLYCSLYPEDFRIERNELIERLIDEGIIEGKKTRQAEYDKGHDMLNKLENANLLEGVEKYMVKYVKMHDLLRDMAIQIAQASHRLMIEAGKGLQDLPDEEEWTDDLIKVSLMRNYFPKIHSNASPRCPKLSTLLLNNNYLLVGIPHSFFVHMLGLKVLNLSYTRIINLPDSVSNLENLKALLLRECTKLTHVPSLAKLTALRRLDTWCSGIKEIPQGLEMLVNLRYLSLFTDTLKISPVEISPKLSRLQYLSFYWNSMMFKVKKEELAYLKKLEKFNCQFNDIHDFNTYVRFLEGEGGPSNYILLVGISFTQVRPNLEYIPDKIVFLCHCSISKSIKGEDSLVLPKDIRTLYLYYIDNLRSLCDVPSFNNAAELKTVIITSCEGIDHILSSSSFPSCILPLQSVECVSFSSLNNLNVLIREERAGSSPVPPGTFSRLKEFVMDDCGNIKKVFTPELLLHLHNLEVIDIILCDELVEIIGASSNEAEEEDDNDKEERNKEEGLHTTKFYLPKLKVFKLCYLPRLKSICNSSQLMVCDSIQEIEIIKCPELKRLPLSLLHLNGKLCPPPSLKKIEAEKEWWESLELDHPNSKIVLESIFVEFSDAETSDEESETEMSKEHEVEND